MFSSSRRSGIGQLEGHLNRYPKPINHVDVVFSLSWTRDGHNTKTSMADRQPCLKMCKAVLNAF